MLCGKLSRLNEEKKYAEKEYKATQAEIISLLDNNKGGYTDNHKISVTVVPDSPGKVITGDMVGQVTGKRKGYIKLNVKEN